jgi:mono/diheme cytochrome c family protein
MAFVAGIIVALVVEIGVGLAVVYSGGYNVAASYPHGPIATWLLETTMDRSVEAHAAALPTPPANLDARREQGAKHYQAMCVECHGAPGVKPGELAEGMLPRPPNLEKSISDLNSKQIFWIVKNGVRMTGMPAWGKVDDDKEIWDVVAFVKSLPQLTPKAYRDMAGAPAESDEHRVEHGHAGH